MICHLVGEANLYFNMYLTYKDETHLLRALRVHYNHTIMLCIENNMYFDAQRVMYEDKQQYQQQLRLIS